MKTRVLLVAQAALLLVVAQQASAATITINTFKDNTVKEGALADTVFDSEAGILSASGYDNTIPTAGTMTYAAFDLSSIPAGAIITGARVGAYDARTNRSHTIIASLANVADGWGESTLTWNIATASYGAATGIEGNPDGNGGLTAGQSAMVNPGSVLWQGTMLMNANPGFVWAVNRAGAALVNGSDSYHGGVDWTDADLIAALQAVYDGDKTAVIVYSGYVGVNNYISERAVNPAAIEITYEIPEPASLGLLASGAVQVFLRRRSA